MAINWTDQQRDAITTQAPALCVDAGAGSGKTFVLVERLVHLIETHGADLDHIVAITFTEKAAAEMKVRLRKVFRQRANTGDRETMNRWRALERRVDAARLTTIHSFCAGLLREHALLLGIDPEYTLLAEAEQRIFEDRVVTETLHDLLEAGDTNATTLTGTFRFGTIVDMLKGLSGRRAMLQKFAESCPLDDPAAYQAYCREQAIAAFNLRMELLARHPALRSLLSDLEEYGKSCVKANRREEKRAATCEVLRALLDGAGSDELQRCLVVYGACNSTGARPAHWSDPETYAKLSARMKEADEWIGKFFVFPEFDAATETEAAALGAALLHVHGHVQEAMRTRKATINAMDFNDLLEKAREALCGNDTLRARAAADIDYLLIDEFQDTDGVQLDLALALSNQPGGPDLFIVGDAKQSIYRFRGADVSVFNAQRDRSKVLPLRLNFRSLPDVLHFVNAYYHKSGALWAVEPVFQDLETFREAGGGARVELLVPGVDDGDEKRNKREGREQEAWMIAQRILALCGPDAPETVCDEHTGVFRRAVPGDFALLFRAMSNVAIYEEALREAGIPYILLAGGGFYERQEVLDILNLLKVVLDPWNEAALFAFLRSPIAALSDVDLFWMAQSGTLTQVFYGDVVPEAMPHPERLTRARALLARLQANRNQALGAFMQTVMTETDCEAINLGMPQGVQRAANLRKILDLAEDFSSSQSSTLRAFVRYLDDVRSKAVREGEATLQPEAGGAVTIMTVHRSKGLEFGVVFLPDISAQGRGDHDSVRLHPQWGLAVSIPNETDKSRLSGLGQMIAVQEKLETEAESARLFYVAMTRARDMLIMSGAPERSGGSWLDDLDKAYGILDAEDGKAIWGVGWRMIVRRKLDPGPPLYGERPARETLPTRETLERQAGPIMPVIPQGGVISVSEVLNRLFDDKVFDDEPEKEREEYPARGRDFALTRGTLVHQFFEEWDFSDTFPNLDLLLLPSGLDRTEQGRISDDVVKMANWFRSTDLCSSLRADAALQREAPFLWRIGNGIVSGTIDLLTSTGVPIDFKTGKHDSGHDKRYAMQLQIYAAAVEELLGHSPAEGYLIYVDEQRVEHVNLAAMSTGETRKMVEEALVRAAQPAGVGCPPGDSL